jgi:hypothetical protein
MLYDEQTQGHDAQLDGLAIDVLRRTVSLRLSTYPRQDAPDRVAIEIAFSNVEQVHTIADLVQLSDHHTLGNVNHWHVAEGPGTSYFYLVEGCLVITAQAAPVLSLR